MLCKSIHPVGSSFERSKNLTVRGHFSHACLRGTSARTSDSASKNTMGGVAEWPQLRSTTPPHTNLPSSFCCWSAIQVAGSKCSRMLTPALQHCLDRVTHIGWQLPIGCNWFEAHVLSSISPHKYLVGPLGMVRVMFWPCANSAFAQWIRRVIPDKL